MRVRQLEREQNAQKSAGRYLVLFMIVGVVAVMAFVLGVLALANDQTTKVAAPAQAGAVAVGLSDFRVASSATTVKAGLVDFAVTNNGPQAHEFLVFRTDLAARDLPIGADGRVDEEAEGATKVFDSGDNIEVGQTQTFHAALTEGAYVLICNLPAHYKSGMFTAFKVTHSPVVPTPVDSQLSDFAVTATKASVPAGLVDFAVRNDGPSQHEFLIFKTDLAADKLPLGDDGRVNEDAEDATKVFDSGDNIEVGKSQRFNVGLTPGNYVLLCNLPGHYTKGMRTTFSVT